MYLHIIIITLLFLFTGCQSQPSSPTVTPHFTATSEPTLASTPTSTPVSTPTSTPTESSEDILQVELNISLDPAIASSLERQSSQETDNMMWEDWEPGFIIYKLKGYPLENRQDEARIFIYRVSDIEGKDQHSSNNISNLRQFLQSKLDIGAYPVEGVEHSSYYVPWLVPINATPIMHAGVEYLDFQNGTGMRYLTQYAQALSVINNEELYYTFQGLTQDEEYYIAAVWPVYHPDMLPGANDAPNGDTSVWGDVKKNIQYMREAVQILDEAQPSSFTPDLTKLDAMARSISIQ